MKRVPTVPLGLLAIFALPARADVVDLNLMVRNGKLIMAARDNNLDEVKTRLAEGASPNSSHYVQLHISR
jgi:hypothetical protein